MPGFCKSPTLEKIAAHGYVLTVGAEELEDEDTPLDEEMESLTKKLEQQFTESAILEAAIRENLRRLGL